MSKISRKVKLEKLMAAAKRLELRIGVLQYDITGVTNLQSTRNKGLTSKAFWDDPDGLSPLQRRFVEEYPKDLNGKRSAIRAGYSRTSAHVIACGLLKKTKIIKALRKEYEKVSKRNNLEVDTVVREICRLAYSNIGDFVTWSDTGIKLVTSTLLSRDDTACIKEVSETKNPKGTTVKIKLYDKTTPLITLSKYLGLLDGDTNNKETAEEQREKLNDFIRSMVQSVPSKQPVPEKLPDNVELFDKKVRALEDRY